MQKSLIVYAEKSLAVRRVINDDESALINISAWIGPGEAAVLVDREHVELHDIPTGLARALGVHRDKITTPRCVTVDEHGVVINTLMADPEIDRPHHASHRLIAHPHATNGWKLHSLGYLYDPDKSS